MMRPAALLCVLSLLESVDGTALHDGNIRTAVDAWLSDSAAAEAAYGHISTWETGGVTDMSFLFCGTSYDWSQSGYCNTAWAAFNEDIGAWDTSGVTTMTYMFCGASAFNQDLGWCVDDNVDLFNAFGYTPCASTSCGVAQPENYGDCDVASTGNVMVSHKLRWAVSAWLADATAAEATYGHISTWETSGVTDMSKLFCAEGLTTCNSAAAFFNEDIGAWDISGVTTMVQMFYEASAFDQDLGWCVDNAVSLVQAYEGTPCVAASCGVYHMAVPSCGGTVAHGDGSIRTAVTAWLADATAAEATYGHISTWDTSRVTYMSYLFCADQWNSNWSCNKDARAFNEDIGAWDTSGVKDMRLMFYYASAFDQDLSDWIVDSVTNMRYMFYSASAFDQDLGWCLYGVDLDHAFRYTPCESTSCGVVSCETKENDKEETLVAVIAGAAAAALLLVVGAFYFYRRRKASMMMDKADEPSEANPEPTELSAPEEAATPKEATSPESLETRTSAKAKAAETVELSFFSTKLTSFLFREQEEAPKEEEATIPVAPEGEEASTEQPPPPPPRRWFSRAESEPEPAAPKAEEMYNQIAAWYDAPENAALRATWGAYPDPDDFQTWPGFVAVTNAFLDREAG